MKGLDYAEANFPFIDKTRECALGASYGGYMADWVLTHTNRFKCIVTHDGLYDAGAAWGSTEEMWFPEWEFRRPEDFPKGWDGFEGYDPVGGRKAKAGPSTAPRADALGSAQDDKTNANAANPLKRSLGTAHRAGDRTVPSAVAGSRASGSFDSSRSAGLAQDDRVKANAGVPPLRAARSGRDDGEKQRGSPSGMTNKGESGGGSAKGESGGGHAAEPWRYAGLPASEDPFRRWSPKEYIQNAKTPTLVIHSQHDYRLDVSQGFELYTALQRQGVPSRFLYFPDEGHWVLKPQNSELWNAVVSDWCDRWTKSGKYAQAQGAGLRQQGTGR
jgi:pimeloyl-ACP methyl ester carboxylesterase